MASEFATVNGWRGHRDTGWWPSTANTWTGCSEYPQGYPCMASSPTYNDNSVSNYRFTTIIKVTMPNTSNIGVITSIEIGFKVQKDIGGTNAKLYGSLRTVYDNTENQYTLEDYRMDIAGNSEEVSITVGTDTDKCCMTFNGTFERGKSYYLWLYTRDSNHRYLFLPNSSDYYYCNIDYDIKTYIVSYNANGHGTAPTNQTKAHDKALTLHQFIANQTGTGYEVSYNANGGSSTPSNKTSAITYKQTYWNTNSSGTGTNYGSKASYTNNSNIKLYAIWSSINGSITLADGIEHGGIDKSYTISYNANGGNNAPSNQTLKRHTSYLFDKWREGSTTGKAYDAGASYTPSKDTTMYASWKVGETTGSVSIKYGIDKDTYHTNGYTVALNTNGGSCDSTNIVATDMISYEFKEWNTKSDGSGTSYKENTSYSGDSNLSLYAIFDSKRINGSISLPTPTKSGYIFLGWSTENGATSYVDTNYTPSSNITLYANYKKGFRVEMYLYNGGRWMNVLMS